MSPEVTCPIVEGLGTKGRTGLSSSSVERFLDSGVLQVLLPPGQHTEDTFLQLLLASDCYCYCQLCMPAALHAAAQKVLCEQWVRSW
jgi:hypothetical protein